jgi:cytochrome o ubiquinol oxidase subunit III
MTHLEAGHREHFPDVHHDVYSRTVFGFWVYLLTDFMMFAALFATYAVLQKATYGGPSGRELFDLRFNLFQTLVLLTSSFTAGVGGAWAHRRKKHWTIVFFGITFLLGSLFLGMVFADFFRFLDMGNSWKNSAFLSAYFTLVGTHAIHIFFGLLWILVFIPQVFWKGTDIAVVRRLTCLRMFWQFCNIVWIFIFSFVYLMGADV